MPERNPDKPVSYLEHHYPEVNWSWNVHSGLFEYDSKLIEDILPMSHPVSSVSEILQFMSQLDRESIKKSFIKALTTHSKEYLSCCLTFDRAHLVYVEFFIQSDQGKGLKGTLKPLLVMPDREDFGVLFQQLFNNQHHGIIVANDHQRVVICNHYFEEHIGYLANQIVGKHISKFDSGKHTREYYDRMWSSIEGKGYWTGTLLIKNANGDAIAQELTVQKLSIDSRVFYIGFFVDLSSHLYRIAEQEDGGVELLTQLSTKQQFTSSLIKQCLGSSEDIIDLAIAFQPKFEHEQDFQQKPMLSESLTRNPKCRHVGYLGNNVFMVSVQCQKGTSGDQIEILHRTIRQFFNHIYHSAGDIVKQAIIQGKVGVSILGHDTDDPKRMVNHAIQSMLECDQQGLISFYHGVTHKQIMRRKHLEEVVVACIKNQSVEVFYQPIVDTSNWDVVKFEALCRFKSPDGQMYNTQEMVAIAEDLELVSELDLCVGVASLNGLKRIQDQYGERIGITINRSLNTKLGAEVVLSSALQMVREFAHTPELVTIELTESAYFDSESSQSDLIHSLREHKVSVAIDDFGTGYSSFTYLSDCNFDLLKIDREFVVNLKVGTHRYFIVKMITELSHTLDVKVVAEGVETQQELEVLCGLGVDFIQGYFFSKPLPLGQIEQAWGYQERLDEFLDSSSMIKGIGILSIVREEAPVFTPDVCILDVKKAFDADPTLEAVCVIVEERCVGVVDKATLQLYLTSTIGTKLETAKDLAICKRTLNQVMKTKFETIDFKTKAKDISGLLNEISAPPWVITNDFGVYLGLVTQGDILAYFSAKA
ncbi:EAL domain-containing protein [Vibrio sp. T187]|uniref:EAL domain-containing protein n=1 Tax=Vibrio TaxID=662 RepID=UPI0010CA1B4F|nr:MULTISPECIES: EAL domain-containing protein [Vibrio]MBW3694750.1 EAL domain-containing protein [Vibrio sp. T187]